MVPDKFNDADDVAELKVVRGGCWEEEEEGDVPRSPAGV